jgi:hypothetical protein
MSPWDTRPQGANDTRARLYVTQSLRITGRTGAKIVIWQAEHAGCVLAAGGAQCAMGNDQSA